MASQSCCGTIANTVQVFTAIHSIVSLGSLLDAHVVPHPSLSIHAILLLSTAPVNSGIDLPLRYT